MQVTMQVTIKGEVYDFDPMQVDNQAWITVERVTGMTAGEWQDALTRNSMTAGTALVWLVLRMNGKPDLAFEDVVFKPGEVDVEVVTEEPGKDPDPATEPEAAESPAS